MENSSNVAIIQQPDGEIAMISKKNPYYNLGKKETSEIPNIDENINDLITIPIEASNYVLVIPESLIDKVYKIEIYKCNIQFICLLDFFNNMTYVFYGRYEFLSFIFGMFSLFGYYSTFTHDRNLLIGYLIYQYFITIGKSLSFILLLIASNKQGLDFIKKNIPYLILEDKISVNIILFYLLFLLLQFYILNFVRFYYYLLPNFNERKRIFIRSVNDNYNIV